MRYSPLQANGNGIQSVYLTDCRLNFAEVLARLIGSEATSLMLDASATDATNAGLPRMADDPDMWEHRLEAQIEADQSVPETEKQTLIRARHRVYSKNASH